MTRKIKIIIIICISCCCQVYAQRGGESLFGIQNVPQSPRVAALGSNQVGIYGADLALLINNPAILDSALTNHISISYTPYLADINYGFAAYSRTFNNIGNFALGFSQIGYGKFIGADEYGNLEGEFSANETVIQLVYSKKILPQWHVGASLKPIFSRIETYSAWGLGFNAGFFYKSTNELTTAGFVLRNVGRQINAYNEKIENMRPDIQIGLSTKLAHAPFRFSVTMQDILSRSLLYVVDDENVNPYWKNDNTLKGKWINDVFRRFTFGVEIVPTKNFYIGAGYNPRRRQEMKIESNLSTVGFTWGFGIKVYKFNISYGSGLYHLAGNTNHFSITTNLSSF